MKIRMPSPAMIVALVAIACASTGSAIAATLITGAQIQNGTVTGLDIRKGTLTTVHVKNGTLLPIDFKKLPLGPAGPRGPAGPAGPQGQPGQQGQQGPQGASGLASLQRVDVHTGSTSGNKGITANCPAGSRVVGGGALVDGPVGVGSEVSVYESRPTDNLGGWAVGAAEIGNTLSSWVLFAYAICAPSA